MDSAELTEWLGYYRLEPWGEDRDDLRAGMVAAAVLNPWRGSDEPPLDPWDLVPDFAGDRRPRPEELSPEEVRERARRLTAALARGDDGHDDRQPGGGA